MRCIAFFVFVVIVAIRIEVILLSQLFDVVFFHSFWGDTGNPIAKELAALQSLGDVLAWVGGADSAEFPEQCFKEAFWVSLGKP